MGLDVALGVIILIAAIRGWLQGFVYQAIRIGGLVAGIYLAAPVRDQAKPHIVAYCRRCSLICWIASCGGFRPPSLTR